MKNSAVSIKNNRFSRRDFLSLSGKVGIATLPLLFGQKVHAEFDYRRNQKGVNLFQHNHSKSPDWIAEARIAGFSIGTDLSDARLDIELSKLIKQGVNVVEADSRLSDYLSKKEFKEEMQRITEIVEKTHAKGLKVVWYIPALEVITANGVTREDSFAKTYPDWLQVSFDGKDRGFFYGQKVFWVEATDESAWLCPNSPYREYLQENLKQLAATGVDGIWLDVPIFDQIAVTFACSCHYCQDKFRLDTGLKFPTKYDVNDTSFWRFTRWRHDVITSFLDDCKVSIESANSETVTMAEIVALDHTGATQLGSEGSDLKNILIIWEVDAISETTAMAEASYDDWMALYNIYKYCRGATMDRPSWAFCYGYNEADAQLVMASSIATQNNPYELRVPQMGSSIGEEFRATQFNWIKQYSKQIFRSNSLAPVAVIYSERNRDFLDATKHGGIFVSEMDPGRDRNWLGTKHASVVGLDYLGDYRGLSILLYQNQIPTDIYPFSRVDDELLSHYSVLVLPFMASLSKKEKRTLLTAVRNGATLIITGVDPGLWDENVIKREHSLWHQILGGSGAKETIVNYGKGRLFFWKKAVGQDYLKTHDQGIVDKLLKVINQSGVESWVTKKSPVVVQPYLYGKQMVIHVLNYSWVGALNNQPNRINVELSVPWRFDSEPTKIVQTEPSWTEERKLKFKRVGARLVVSINVGINAMVLIDT